MNEACDGKLIVRVEGWNKKFDTATKIKNRKIKEEKEEVKEKKRELTRNKES